MNIHIRNGRLIDPANQVDTQQDLFIVDGKVAAMGAAPAGFKAEREIDAAGLIVAPGLVDLSARLREPGFEHKATLESEMQAAMAGGITRLACPPDTDPVLDEPGLVEMLCFRAKKLNCAHVYPIGALTTKLEGKRITEMAELVEAGCVAFSQANTPVVDTQVLMRAMQYAATFGFRVWLQPQDPHLARNGVAHDGEVASRLGLTGIPVEAETIALETQLALARLTGVKLHITRVSSAAALECIERARASGVDVTCDVAAHHLHLTEMDIGYFNPQCYVIPPLRSQRDRAALRAALATGRINAVCSDHTPVDDDAKQAPFAESEAGMTGLELLLSLVLKWAQEDKLPLTDALARVTSNAAAIMGITKGGHLGVGARADVVIFDARAERIPTRESLRSQGKNTPFLGLPLPGTVRYTLVEGRVMFG
ncbi:MAG: dihydroorotase [Candidatus Dactylopiibacterium carminicum]|uniref:Dihydroorotase n=1 Tax=Candidatus Dactylopiibacterium carminicum TaxID=857335 RepID=A0A272EPL2_9RHOO|nr:dihydroorotase [Candidatus Dactylopiibacterium carminicum]KAF7598479.1 dihydroorotase [Candidatus Dactylopiibacterium carminicum]PAS92074.1 MAG: dihydroorotase [Candidatus Dactylopiibacterium carminicum]PAS95496.1 MAG: dihydroorotase [Candidatus Dactylopiibacterium carminicum]PAS97878.1 MAG: dihydroorotase [Candidatus Dactylopiibacterium carminicum]